MSIIKFPREPMKQPTREARLEREEARMLAWTNALGERSQAAWDDWYTLHEISAATGIPMARLPTVLRRCAWRSKTEPGFGRLWHSPFEPADL
jgi:hypothetical protein